MPLLDKIIFTGPVGAGKTTAIAAISEDPPVSTDVRCTDDTIKMKNTTTVAMDYSYITLDDGVRIHLYGTPGQERFNFMWKILARGGIGLVLLVNRDNNDPLKTMEFYLDAFDEFAKNNAVVIGVTRSGVMDQTSIAEIQHHLYERNQVFPVFEVDARNGDDIKLLVQALLATLQH